MRNGQTEKKSVVRPATQANLFYTGDARELREEVDSFLALNRGRTIFNNVAAVIVPHAGRAPCGLLFLRQCSGCGIYVDSSGKEV